MPKTPTKVLRETNNLIVKDKGTPTATTREGERRNTTISRRRRRRTEKRERKTAEQRSDPIDPIRSERERDSFSFFSLCVIFDIIIIVWCNHHHSPSRKTRGKKGKKERKKEKKKSRDDEDDEDDEEEEYGVGGIRTIQQE